jgi:hypothetical protein
LEDGQKIAAIKLARKHGREFPGREAKDELGHMIISHACGLRNAKDAVEALNGSNVNPTAKFIPQLRIKRFVVDTEEGELELDLDGLQLRLLGSLNEASLSDVAELVEVVSFIRKWQGDIEE